ncbi:hypothetical protein LCGC14_1659950 [marine sediment metagenome]|uniref:Uncharacterized protein n=1 Tax=marine sediment metagenome TaxID=412755 RepID=A0A0F9KA83_9ZZZZ
MKRFKLYWLDGKEDIITGDNIQDACRRAGIGNGASRAIDYWKELD